MRANRGKILLNVFLLMLLFLSFTPWFPQPPLTQIAQLEDGSVFLLSDYFDFAWDDVEVLNTFSRLTREQYDALIDAAGWTAAPLRMTGMHRPCWPSTGMAYSVS